MAGRNSKKNQDNFEKIKKEMIAKKNKAKKTPSSSGATEVGLENHDILSISAKECLTQSQDQLFETIESGDKDNIELIPGCGETTVGQSRQDEKENVHTDDTTRLKLIVFRVNEEEFALRITNIKEIIRIPLITQVPSVPEHICGLCSLRGSLLPVVNCRKLFGLPDQEFTESSRIIVADIHGKNVGLVADKVLEVINVEEEAVKEPPASIKGVDGGVLDSILILDDGRRVVMLLDVEKMIDVGTLDEAVNRQVENSTESEKNVDEEEQIVIFNIGDGEFAFGIHDVKEIIRLPETTKVPNTASYVEGVFSLRNQLLAVINLGKLLGINGKQPDEYSRVIIINNGSFSYGVIVDKVSHVAQVQKKFFKAGSRNGDINGTEFVKGIYNLNDGQRLVMMLESHRLISAEDVKVILDGEHQEQKNSVSTGEADISLEYVVFKLGGEEYGIKINNVQEINNIGEITHFPGAPAFISGLVDLRGDLIPISDLRKLFHVEQPDADHGSKFLVAEFGNKKIGILIDSVSGVLRFSRANLEEASEALRENDQDCYIDKIAKLDDGKRIVLLLNLSTMLSFM